MNSDEQKQRQTINTSQDKRRAVTMEPKRTDARSAQSQHRAYPDIIDDTLDDSFPASDPPSWAGH